LHAQRITANVRYAQNQVVDLPDETMRVLGNSSKRADDRDIEEEARFYDAGDPAERKQCHAHSEPGNAQNSPDVARANDAKAKDEEEAKALARALVNKLVKGVRNK
jgi:hypothetical protein